MRAATSDILLLTAIAALAQFANNIYLPSLPAIAADLDASATTIQLTVTVFLACLGLVQLGYGPLADRHGRRPVFTGGACLFLAGTLLAMVAQSAAMLIAARALQAIGAGAGIVVSRAIARDRFDGPELGRVFALMTMAFGLVPAVVPLLGGVLQQTLDWHAPFAATFLVGLAVLAIFRRRQPESLAKALPALDPATIAAAYLEVARSRRFLGSAMAASGALGGLFAFFTGSPFVFMEVLGVTPIEYGFYPPIAVLGFVVGAFLSKRWTRDMAPLALARRGLLPLALGALAMVGPPLAGLLHPFQINAAILVWVMGLGLIMPAMTQHAMTPFGHVAGTASALLGFLQMSGAAVASAAVGALTPWSVVLAFPVVMVMMALVGAIGVALAGGPAAQPSAGSVRVG
jgi:DHA1 family bicyclomycin/chloramphenicol resistance-like MFS transporter